MNRQEKKEKRKQETLELLKKFRPNIEIDEENSNENWTALKQKKDGKEKE